MTITQLTQLAGRILMSLGFLGALYVLVVFRVSDGQTPSHEMLHQQQNGLIVFGMFAVVGAALYMAGITAAVKAGSPSPVTPDRWGLEDQLSWKRDGREFLHPLIVASVGVVLLWILSAALAYAFIDGPAERGQFGDLFGAINSLFSGLAFAAVAIALVLQTHSLRLQRKELHDAQEWNRKKASQDIVVDSTLGQFGTLRRKFEARSKADLPPIRIYTNQTISDVVLDDAEVRELDAILNYLETVCISMQNKVLDEAIVRDSFQALLLAYVRWAEPYIVECQKQDVNFWAGLKPTVKAWSARQSPAVAEEPPASGAPPAVETPLKPA